jgi:hypothetical protein
MSFFRPCQVLYKWLLRAKFSPKLTLTRGGVRIAFFKKVSECYLDRNVAFGPGSLGLPAFNAVQNQFAHNLSRRSAALNNVDQLFKIRLRTIYLGDPRH